MFAHSSLLTSCKSPGAISSWLLVLSLQTTSKESLWYAEELSFRPLALFCCGGRILATSRSSKYQAQEGTIISAYGRRRRATRSCEQIGISTFIQRQASGTRSLHKRAKSRAGEAIIPFGWMADASRAHIEFCLYFHRRRTSSGSSRRGEASSVNFVTLEATGIQSDHFVDISCNVSDVQKSR